MTVDAAVVGVLVVAVANIGSREAADAKVKEQKGTKSKRDRGRERERGKT